MDALNDYRYYSADQLPRLNRIIALKERGFTLEQIAALLNDDLSPDQLRGMLRFKRAQVEQEMRAQQARLLAIEARLRQIEYEALSAYDVIIRAVEAERGAALRTVLPKMAGTEALFNELEAYIAHHKARAARPPLCIYHDQEYREQDIDLEIAVSVTDDLPSSPRISVRELPRVETMACVVHVGPYTSIDAAYHALFAWIEAHGYGIAGPLREVYLRFGADTTDYDLPAVHLTHTADAYVTELQLPVEHT